MPSLVERTLPPDPGRQSVHPGRIQERSGMAMAGKQSVNKGWFNPGRPGDRTLDQQLNGRIGCSWRRGQDRARRGLRRGPDQHRVGQGRRDRSARRRDRAGAREGRANKLRGDLPVTFEVGDANVAQPAQLRHRDRAGAAAEGAQPTAVAARLPPRLSTWWCCGCRRHTHRRSSTRVRATSRTTSAPS